jgi:tetratricopeptide (TPR) repeat protein
LEHSDKAKAAAIVKELKVFLDGLRIRPEYEIPLRSRLAALRFRTGDAQTARDELAAAMELYDKTREKEIINMFRAGVLRVVAQAYVAIGDDDSALKVYRRAIEEGVVNINSRPRAMDLCETCVSMALNQIEPDEKLWARIKAINEELGDPW